VIYSIKLCISFLFASSQIEDVDAGYHGTSGPMKIADLQLTPLVEAFLNAGRELSYDVLDVNGPNQLGQS